METFSDNVEGSFFVTTDCIACDTCVGLAAACFQLTYDCDHAYVKKQPLSDDERTNCFSAKAACPVEAIGYRG